MTQPFKVPPGLGIEVFLLAEYARTPNPKHDRITLVEGGGVLVLLEGTSRAIVAPVAWESSEKKERIQILADLEHGLRRAEAARRAEEDPRIGILTSALLEARTLAMQLAGAIAFSPGGDYAREIVARLEDAVGEVRRIERGR